MDEKLYVNSLPWYSQNLCLYSLTPSRPQEPMVGWFSWRCSLVYWSKPWRHCIRTNYRYSYRYVFIYLIYVFLFCSHSDPDSTNLKKKKMASLTWVFVTRRRPNCRTALVTVSRTTGSAPVSADAWASCFVYRVSLFPPHGEGCANGRRTLTFCEQIRVSISFTIRTVLYSVYEIVDSEQRTKNGFALTS